MRDADGDVAMHREENFEDTLQHFCERMRGLSVGQLRLARTRLARAIPASCPERTDIIEVIDGMIALRTITASEETVSPWPWRRSLSG